MDMVHQLMEEGRSLEVRTLEFKRE